MAGERVDQRPPAGQVRRTRGGFEGLQRTRAPPAIRPVFPPLLCGILAISLALFPPRRLKLLARRKFFWGGWGRRGKGRNGDECVGRLRGGKLKDPVIKNAQSWMRYMEKEGNFNAPEDFSNIKIDEWGGALDSMKEQYPDIEEALIPVGNKTYPELRKALHILRQYCENDEDWELAIHQAIARMGGNVLRDENGDVVARQFPDELRENLTPEAFIEYMLSLLPEEYWNKYFQNSTQSRGDSWDNFQQMQNPVVYDDRPVLPFQREFEMLTASSLIGAPAPGTNGPHLPPYPLPLRSSPPNLAYVSKREMLKDIRGGWGPADHKKARLEPQIGGWGLPDLKYLEEPNEETWTQGSNSDSSSTIRKFLNVTIPPEHLPRHAKGSRKLKEDFATSEDTGAFDPMLKAAQEGSKDNVFGLSDEKVWKIAREIKTLNKSSERQLWRNSNFTGIELLNHLERLMGGFPDKSRGAFAHEHLIREMLNETDLKSAECALYASDRAGLSQKGSLLVLERRITKEMLPEYSIEDLVELGFSPKDAKALVKVALGLLDNPTPYPTPLPPPPTLPPTPPPVHIPGYVPLQRIPEISKNTPETPKTLQGEVGIVDAPDRVRAYHVLLKHKESRSPVSSQDPTGQAIQSRSKEEATQILQDIRLALASEGPSLQSFKQVIIRFSVRVRRMVRLPGSGLIRLRGSGLRE
ncbi:hypothetical protein AAMO2058_000187600 [Amorphochlora amoebiformis]